MKEIVRITKFDEVLKSKINKMDKYNADEIHVLLSDYKEVEESEGKQVFLSVYSQSNTPAHKVITLLQEWASENKDLRLLNKIADLSR